MTTTLQSPVSLQEAERPQVRELAGLLEEGTLSLVDSKGHAVALSQTVQQVLSKVVSLMLKGQAVSILPDQQAITTQRAADLLGMSRPFFIKLLETGTMPYHRVGNQRRVYLKDVLLYAQRREEERQAALDRLSKSAMEAGLYERNRFPEAGSDE